MYRSHIIPHSISLSVSHSHHPLSSTGIAVSQLAQEILAVVCEHLVQVYDDVKLILGHGNDRIVIQQGLVSIEFTNASNATTKHVSFHNNVYYQ